MANEEIGTYIKTPWGVGMIASIDPQRERYLVTFDDEYGPGRSHWIDAETVLPEERNVFDLRDPEIAEKFLSGEPITKSQEPVAARDIQCQPVCGCMWCYTVSSNGFHMSNQGQCRCEEKGCRCLGEHQ